MSEEGPKLFTNKPKKAQVKQYQQQHPSPPSMATPASSQNPTPPPPPQPPKVSFARRYKFLWPLLLTVNFAVGAYLFTRTKKKNSSIEGGELPDSPPSPISTTAPAATSVIEKSVPLPPLVEPIKVREPIPENQQRELFKWILEEKRKVKPKDAEEKKRIDEEKAILKQFLRAKSIPSL
ncbi:hypothetical protein RJ640_008493 [Escallonia rubra]|uniref:Uncharacterized protein n=1 Tax=Escallonia rubra TaxID=112253 RepID=A0AA88RAY1_9ASTE|nr:hypothetical protein RJ640_008493 [Escallonia rubra]